MADLKTRLMTVTLVLVAIGRLDNESRFCMGPNDGSSGSGRKVEKSFSGAITNARYFLHGKTSSADKSFADSRSGGSSRSSRSSVGSSRTTEEEIKSYGDFTRYKEAPRRLKSIARDSANLCKLNIYSIEEMGWPMSPLDYGMYLLDENDSVVSPFHDVQMVVQGTGDLDEEQRVYHMVVEIPRGTNMKAEINLDREMNPIGYELRADGRPRYVDNIFPHRGYMWNYGMIPQTWLDPETKDKYTNTVSEADAVDAIEIGTRKAARGTVLRVKVLGAVAVIDQYETDWKVVVIDVDSLEAGELNDMSDVRRLYPGLLDASLRWFTVYKVPNGKRKNEIAYDGMQRDSASFARQVIDEAHQKWKTMMNRVTDIIPKRANTTLNNKWTVSPNSAQNKMTGAKLREFFRWQYILM